MADTGVMSESRRMAGHYDIHVNTLAQVSTQLRITGSWPAQISMSRGWARAVSRPWNDESADAFLRLERGSADFLATCSEHLLEVTDAAVYSPALYPNATRVWRRAGYVETHRLDVLERSLGSPIAGPDRSVRLDLDPDWDALSRIDAAAFDGFWRMSNDGLHDALAATKQGAVLTIGEQRTTGYAIVGAQWNVAYLQRIAVHPEEVGRGLGMELLQGAMSWARKEQAGVLVLNVRKQNGRARQLYKRAGFAGTGVELQVLRYAS